MIRGDMSVTEFVQVLFNNKWKIGIAVVALIVGPPLYREWRAQQAADQLVADRNAVPTEASIAGIFLSSAWKSCRDIGVPNVATCATYKGVLPQEIGPPVAAALAIQQRDSYLTSCRRFNDDNYCQGLLTRAVQISVAQDKNKTD